MLFLFHHSSRLIYDVYDSFGTRSNALWNGRAPKSAPTFRFLSSSLSTRALRFSGLCPFCFRVGAEWLISSTNSIIDRPTDLTIPILTRNLCHVNSDQDFHMCCSVLAELVHPDETRLKTYRSSHPSPPPMINRIMKGVQEWTPLLLNTIIFQVEWLSFERSAHIIKTFQWICDDAAALSTGPHISFFKSVFISRLFWKAVLSVLSKKRVVTPKKATKAMALEARVGQRESDTTILNDQQDEESNSRDGQPQADPQLQRFRVTLRLGVRFFAPPKTAIHCKFPEEANHASLLHPRLLPSDCDAGSPLSSIEA